MNILKKISRRIREEDSAILIGFLAFFLFFAIYAEYIHGGADYYPMNGDFQNFNPIRRLLSGQIPYRDFQDYLGLGHLYTGAIATFLLGGSFSDSKVAFILLTCLSFAFTLILIGRLIVRNKSLRLLLSVGFLVTLAAVRYLSGGMGVHFLSDISSIFSYALSPNNSSRFIRAEILPISCVLLLLVRHLFLKSPNMQKWRRPFTILSTSAIAAFSFLWSNDYGISCWACIFVMVFLSLLIQERRAFYALACAFAHLLLSILWIAVFAEIFTAGNLAGWLHSLFSTGGYQSWYYGVVAHDKSFYLYELDWVSIVPLAFCVFYFYKLCRSGLRQDSVKRYGIPLYINMTLVCATNEYKLLSVGTASEYSIIVCMICLLSELIALSEKSFPRLVTHHVAIARLAVALAILLDAAILYQTVAQSRSRADGEVMVEALGGYSNHGEDLLKASEFLNGEGFFALYASGQETLEGCFQPSGTDYIIHVLGDSARESYLQAFQEKDFRYAATLRYTFNSWFYWVRRANWFFFKELYSSYHPVFSNSYETYWERNDGDSEHTLTGNYSVRVEEADASSKKIVIDADSDINGIGELDLRYEVVPKGGLSSFLLFHTMLWVKQLAGNDELDENQDVFDANCLRPAGQERIPVMIRHGHGEIMLTSMPSEATTLAIHSASCSVIYTVPCDYVTVNQILTVGGQRLAVTDNTAHNRNCLENIAALGVGGVQSPVLRYEIQEDAIYMSFDESASITEDTLKRNNAFRIVKSSP